MVGCHGVGDVRDAYVGLGVQVVRLITSNPFWMPACSKFLTACVFCAFIRVCFDGNAAYLFITRCIERSRELLWVLEFFDLYGIKDYCSLTRWFLIYLFPVVKIWMKKKEKKRKEKEVLVLMFWRVVWFLLIIGWVMEILNGSLEQIQVHLLEQHVCGCSNINIFQYSMVLFWQNNLKGTRCEFSMWFALIFIIKVLG